PPRLESRNSLIDVCLYDHDGGTMPRVSERAFTRSCPVLTQMAQAPRLAALAARSNSMTLPSRPPLRRYRYSVPKPSPPHDRLKPPILLKPRLSRITMFSLYPSCIEVTISCDIIRY